MAPGGNEFDTPELKGINSGVDEAEDQIRDLEDKEAENIQSEQKNKTKQHKDSIRSLWDNLKYPNFCIMGVPEGEDRAGIENLVKK